MGWRARTTEEVRTTTLRRIAALSIVALVACAPNEVGGVGGSDAAPAPEGGPQRRAGAADDTRGENSPKRRRKQGSRKRQRVRGERTLVTRVIDGDTIELSIGGAAVDVRLIGIDTPESVHPSEPVECFGVAASRFTRATLEGARVRVTYDVERRDRYGRTLAYVFKDGKLFNEVLVARGYAQVYTYPPNVRYADRFLQAERSARRAKRGLWRACPARSGRRRAGSPPTSAAAGGSSDCDPSYRGACIPSYPPDLDCGKLSTAGFRSTGSDPHGLDGDRDGVACE